MIDHESKTAVDEPLDPLVARAAAILRQPEPVRETWRNELLAQVSAPPRVRRAALRVWIPATIAAAFVAGVAMRQLAGRTSDDRIRFSISAPSARQVSLVGDFNGWNPTAVPMRRGSRDVWIVEVRL